MLAGAVAVVLIAGGLTGSDPDSAGSVLLRGHARTVTATNAPDAAAFGASDTRFGLALLRQLSDGDRNVILSPSSVSSALGMAYLGARGDTATAMAHTLRLPATGDRLLAGLHARSTALQRTPNVHAADALWADPSAHTRPDYLDQLATGYDAAVRQVPLRTDPSGAAATVNDAVRDQTRGLIRRIVSADQLTGLGWLLTDAVYLKATWAHPFNAESTRHSTFHTPHGDVTTPYLHRVGTLRCARADGWTAVSLPYQGGRLEMLALLPDGAATTPSADTLHTLSTGLAPRRATLALPKVDLSYSAELSDPLRALGMGPAFGAGADFGGLSADDGPISFVEHRATLAVGEHGTEAAAATSAGVRATSIAVPRHLITFDHPYLMLIRDTHTHEPLFLSRVTNPAPR